MRKYKIGITFNLESKVTDIWANGANQNAIHLFHLISTFIYGGRMLFLFLGDQKNELLLQMVLC